MKNRAIWVGTFREYREEGRSNGYVLLVSPRAAECLYPCEAPKELLIAVKRSDLEKHWPQPGESWAVSASGHDVGTKDVYWQLYSATVWPAGR